MYRVRLIDSAVRDLADKQIIQVPKSAIAAKFIEDDSIGYLT